MSNEELKHIFENSACLTKKQMVSYVNGSMTNEEVHAAETHLNSCAMCSDAIDGMFEQQGKAAETLNTINADFLQSYFETKTINLSAATAQQTEVKKNKTQNLWRTVSLAAGLLLLVVSIWYYRMLHEDVSKPQIAQELPETTHIDENRSVAQQPIAMNEAVKEDNDAPKPEAAPAPKAAAVKAVMADDAAINAPAVASSETKGKRAVADEVVVTGYKVPLMGTDERKTIASEEIEKMPTRTTNNVASTGAGVYQRNEAAPAMHPQTSFGNSYKNQNSDENVATGRAKNEGLAYTTDAIKTLNTSDKLEQANKLYEAKQYNDALNIYLREINNATDYDRKDEARIGAARCYLAVGDKERAKVYLMAVFAKHGKHKREAKRLLKEIE